MVEEVKEDQQGEIVPTTYQEVNLWVQWTDEEKEARK